MQTKVMEKAGGLTLVELLVLLVVAGLLLALAVPSFHAMYAKRAVDSALSSFIDDMNLARAEAIQRGYSVTICQSVDGRQCDANAGSWHQGWIVCAVPGSRDCTAPAGQSAQVLRRQGPLPGIVSFQADSGPGNTRRYLAFNPMGVSPGLASNFVATADASLPDGSGKVCISSVGRVASC